MRIYPQCCTSMYCGRLECGGCRNLPVLEEFKAWVKRTGACVTDPIWCPGVYTIPIQKPEKNLFRRDAYEKSGGDRWFRDVSKE